MHVQMKLLSPLPLANYFPSQMQLPFVNFYSRLSDLVYNFVLLT